LSQGLDVGNDALEVPAESRLRSRSAARSRSTSYTWSVLLQEVIELFELKGRLPHLLQHLQIFCIFQALQHLLGKQVQCPAGMALWRLATRNGQQMGLLFLSRIGLREGALCFFRSSAAFSPCSTKRCRTLRTVCSWAENASAIASSAHPGPSASALSRMLACLILYAALFPLETNSSRCLRSSPVRRTIYFLFMPVCSMFLARANPINGLYE